MSNGEQKKKSGWLLWLSLAAFVLLAWGIATSYQATASVDAPKPTIPDPLIQDLGPMKQMFESSDGYTVSFHDTILTGVQPGLMIKQSEPMYLKVVFDYNNVFKQMYAQQHLCQVHFEREDCVKVGPEKKLEIINFEK